MKKQLWLVCKRRAKKKSKTLYKYKDCRDDFGNKYKDVWVDIQK